ncbi:uncharacterized protein CC84DRAFT_1169653 [Paraphaeosphaeria sporulosa]|uniref:Uncharacterized protein n=1 Tax=Paraphaeosphaeria sporulosa TaxID=1460663 RepID=A0A177BUF3_9PLEO|nr:uncharacterized protein CC84DRAFT_1169653 [Paraphaeosphaeria sporulosa]OAF98914.1 hypothetical protein CC84DRAFT_1169653 [Paraphaeosphaeria sporulosa]
MRVQCKRRSQIANRCIGGRHLSGDGYAIHPSNVYPNREAAVAFLCHKEWPYSAGEHGISPTKDAKNAHGVSLDLEVLCRAVHSFHFGSLATHFPNTEAPLDYATVIMQAIPKTRHAHSLLCNRVSLTPSVGLSPFQYCSQLQSRSMHQSLIHDMPPHCQYPKAGGSTSCRFANMQELQLDHSHSTRDFLSYSGTVHVESPLDTPSPTCGCHKGA